MNGHGLLRPSSRDRDLVDEPQMAVTLLQPKGRSLSCYLPAASHSSSIEQLQ